MVRFNKVSRISLLRPTSGVNQALGAEINDAQTCSKKVCTKATSYFNAVWFSTKVHEGCNCCEVDGEVQANGFKFCKNGEKHGDYIITDYSAMFR